MPCYLLLLVGCFSLPQSASLLASCSTFRQDATNKSNSATVQVDSTEVDSTLVNSTLVNSTLAASPVESTAHSQETASAEQSAAWQDFESQMEALAAKCDQLERPDLATAARNWARRRDPSRHYLYLIDQQYTDPISIDPSDSTAVFWAERVRHLRETFSNALLIEAQQTAQSKELPHLLSAMSKLHWAGYQNPENEGVMTILGRQNKDGKWVAPEWGRIGTPRKSRRPERDLKWQAGSYFEVHSANFHLVTTADPEQASAMIGRLEVWRSLWQQFAVTYWANPNTLRSCLERQRAIPEPRERKHEVVLFANRNQFLASLSHINGIEKSIGYYDGQLRRSFFYLDEEDKQLESTWIHELAHQLFSETGSRTPQPGEESNTWLAEGIAIYFESLKSIQPPAKPDWLASDEKTPAASVGSVWSVGGFEAARLQDARIRWTREGYFVPFAQLTTRGRRVFQTDPNIARTYSQSGAMCHFLLDGGNANHEAAIWELLVLLYSKRDRADSLEALTETDSEELATQYKKWLSFDSSQAPWFDLARANRKLALGYSDLDSKALLQLDAPELYQLQLSASKIDDEIASWLTEQKNLQQLFLDKNEISDNVAIAAIKSNPKLQDLDLAGTGVTDETIEALRGHVNLNQLWLTSTGITDQAVDTLLSIPNLETLDVRGCTLSADALNRLAEKIKDLQK